MSSRLNSLAARSQVLAIHVATTLFVPNETPRLMSSSSPVLPRTAYFASATVIVLHAMFLWSMGHWLWSREHYQFFPIVLLGSSIFAWYRLQDAKWPEAPSLSLRIIAYSAGAFLLFALASYAKSDWLGTLAAITMLWAAVWYIGGKTIARRLRGPVYLLLLAVPLPLNLDLQFIIELQKLASAMASRLLDYWGVVHTISGVAIKTVNREFMVEEACSGIHSLFSCITAMAFWAAIFRYGPIRLVLTILQCTGWVLVANSIRVFSVVYARERWNMDLETGAPHEVLGVATYAGALLLSLSTDQLLRFLVPLHFRNFQADDSKPGRSGIYGETDATDNGLFDTFRKAITAVNRFLNEPRASVKLSRSLVIALIIAGYLPFWGTSAFASLFGKTGTISSDGQFTESITEVVPESLLPNKVNEWQLASVQSVNRTPDDPLGTNSVIWTYEGNGIRAQFSVDGYYPSWHDLSYCYSGLGWKLESASNVNLGKSGYTATKLLLYKENGDFATSYFSCFDSRRKIVQPEEASGSALRVVLNRLRSGHFLKQSAAPITPPVFQVQLMVSRQSQILEHEQELLSALFVTLRETVIDNLQDKKTAETP